MLRNPPFTEPYYKFDELGVLQIPTLELQVQPGEAVSILSTKSGDISTICQKIQCLDLVKQKKNSHHTPVLQCVTKAGNLFLKYSALENITIAENCVYHTRGKALLAEALRLKEYFGIGFSFRVPLRRLTPSQRMLVEVLRGYLTDAHVFVFDNVLSVMGMEERAVFYRIVDKIRKNKGIILYLTTKWENSVRVCDRIVITEDGLRLGEMTSEKVLANPRQLLLLLSGGQLLDETIQTTDTTKFLNMLYTGAEFISHNRQLSEALSFVADNVLSSLHGTATAIYLTDKAKNNFRHIGAKDAAVTLLLEKNFLTYHMELEDCEPRTYYSHIDCDFNTFFEHGQPKQESLLVVPVLLQGEKQGLVAVAFDTKTIIDRQRILYLASFCKEISIIIESSKLMGSSLLLQESNHRIKNNLQIMANLIESQWMHVQGEQSVDVDQVFSDLIQRIQNISATHEMLTRQRMDANGADFVTLAQGVVKAIWSQDIQYIYPQNHGLVSFSCSSALAMVLHELITNAVKYAFPETWHGEKQVAITYEEKGGLVTISVIDNGVGISEDVDYATADSLGFSIVRAIVQMDLNGNLQISNTGHGTCAMLSFPQT